MAKLLPSSLSKIFSRWQSVPIPAEQRAEWTFTTIEGRKPLTISLQLGLKRGRSSSYAPQSVLVCHVGGAGHPCNKDYRYNLIGDAVKNPALLPALHDLKARLTCFIAVHLPDDVAGDTYQGDLAPLDHSDGFSLVRQFGYMNGRGDEMKLNKSFHAICANIEEAVPEIQSIIDQNQHLQPALPLDEFAHMEFAAKISTAWTEIWSQIPPDANIQRRKDDLSFLE